MDLYDVMRTTFSAREYTDDSLDDDVLGRILENARFAPSGGNRQGWRVIAVRDQATKDAIAELNVPAAKRYIAQMKAGENPLNTIDPTSVDDATIEGQRIPRLLLEPTQKAPVVLVVIVDLGVVASSDAGLDRIGVVSGASVYPFVWNVLLAARNEGYGGTFTTLAIAQEPKLKELLGIPERFAVAAVVPLGKPIKQLTKLKRRTVPEYVNRERFDGDPFES